MVAVGTILKPTGTQVLHPIIFGSVPLMAILCDLTGLNRQSVVITFCFADGFTNMLYPTSGLMIIAIGMVGVSYRKWIKWTAKLFIIEAFISVFFMLFSVAVGYH